MRPADEALARRDPLLPLLPLLLDDDLLSAWATEHTGSAVVARRRYLRYKPGTAGVAAAELRSPAWEGARRVLVRVHGPDGPAGSAKLAKALRRSGSAHVLAVDPTGAAALLTPAADRDLPALARLADPRDRVRMLRHVLGRTAAEAASAPRTLSWKPQRRWVGTVDGPDGPVVLRAYRPTDLPRALAGLRMTPGDPRTALVLGVDRRRALVALEHLPGCDLRAGATAEEVAAAGELLAARHDAAVPSGAPGPDAAVAALTAAVRAVAVLRPDLGDRAEALRAAVADRLRRLAPQPPVALHGDFSLDQVVVDRSGATPRLGLLDLDHACVGPAAADLAGALAAARVEHVVSSGGHGGPAQDVVRPLLTGYDRVRDLPPDEAVATHTAAALLRRAGEPFRACDPRWSQRLEELLDASRTALGGVGAWTASRT